MNLNQKAQNRHQMNNFLDKTKQEQEEIKKRIEQSKKKKLKALKENKIVSK